jgi:E3 ubiquitin-protein ligase SDIR1
LDLPVADYDALRALDAENSPHAHSMSEEEINVLPVFKYKFQAQQGSTAAQKRQYKLSLLGALWQKKN